MNNKIKLYWVKGSKPTRELNKSEMNRVAKNMKEDFAIFNV